MLLCNIGVIKALLWINKIASATSPYPFSGKTIRRYSTTILLLGSMSSYVPHKAIHDMYADKSFEHAQQSMVAEFSLAYDDIATALHNYTVLCHSK